MRFLICFLLSSLLLSLFALAVDGFIRISPSTGHFVDEYSRVRIYHGVNVVYKISPFIPITDRFDPLNSLSAVDIDNLNKWGFNAVRLGVMWQAVEPTKGVFDDGYLKEISNLIKSLGENGIYTIVDFHQDLLHPSMCGEGIPTHALNATMKSCDGILPEVAKLLGICKSIADYHLQVDNVTKYPLASDCIKNNFALYYASPDVSSAFDSLYHQPSIREGMINYWKYMANYFKDNEYVLGFDLLNEPWAGNIWKDLLLLEPGSADKYVLQPLYQEINTAIRSVNENHIVMYEGTQVPDVLPLGGIVFPNGFTHSPSGSNPAYRDREALSYHVYCCQSAASACDHNGNVVDKYNSECDKFNHKKVSTRVKDAKRLNGGGAFMTEFGACTVGENCIKELTRTTKAADELLQSWAVWSFKYYNDLTTQSGPEEGFYDSNGDLIVDKVKALSRSYAEAIAGEPVSMHFNETSAQFNLIYRVNLNITEPTIVFINKQYYYNNGFTVQVVPEYAADYSFNANINRIYFRHNTTAIQDQQEITVTVSAN